MLGKRLLHHLLIGFIFVLGIGSISTSGLTTAQAITAVSDLSPQVDIMAVIADPDTGLTTTEASGTDTFDVYLDADPGGLVTVNLSSSDTSEGTISPATMDFDTGDFADPQLATITGVNDDIDDGDQPYTIELTSSEGDKSVAVTNEDDDPTPTVSFTTDLQTEGEDIGTMTITAALSGESGSDVTVPYTLSGSATQVDDYTIAPDPLVISAGSLSADLTITVIEDALDEDDEDVVVTMGTPVNADPGATTVHTATITDNDPTPTVSFTAAAQTGAENVGNLTVTAELSAVSGREVTVPYLLSGSATEIDDYTIAPNPLVIPAGNLSADITITVIDDGLGEEDEEVIITMDSLVNADPGATTVHTATITETVTVAFTVGAQEGAESIGTMTVTAELSALSGLEVTVPYTLSGTATEDVDYSIAPADSLVITAGNLSTDLTITIVEDDLDEGDEDIVVTMGTPVNADPGTTTIHTATITDNDIFGITILDPETSLPPVELLTSEDGLSDSFTVELDSEPTENVTIGLSSNNETEGTIDKPSLTFTPTTWDDPQTVTITGVDDSVADGDIVYNIITDPATSGDIDYDGLDPDDIVVNNSDDDTPGFTVIPKDGLWTTEGKITTIINVLLKSKPTSQVTLDFTSTKPDEGTVSPTQIIVNPGDWAPATLYEVKVTGVDDTQVDGDINYKVKMVSTSSDADYGGKTISRNVVNYDAPSIEWVLPVGDDEVYEIDDLVPILLKVKKLSNEPISKVRFYRYSESLKDHVTIGEVSEPPYQLFLDPADLDFEFNQVFAFAFSPEPSEPDGMQTFSEHKRINIFRREEMVYRVYLPIVYNQSNLTMSD